MKKWSLQSRVVDCAWKMIATLTAHVPPDAHVAPDADVPLYVPGVPFMESFEGEYNMVNLTILHSFHKEHGHCDAPDDGGESDPSTRLAVLWTVVHDTHAHWCNPGLLSRSPSRVSTLVELFLCEVMHQISLCIACDTERRDFIAHFRKEFRKQVVIATYVIGPLIRDAPTGKLSEAFGKYGYVPGHVKVPFNFEVAVYVGCEHIVPVHMTPASGFISSVAEIKSCLLFLCIATSSVKHGRALLS
jgi:hypothetical protein